MAAAGAVLVRSPQLSQLASVTPGHGPSACRLELRPEAADCSELDLADAFAVCRPQDPAQLAQLRQEVVSSMVGLAGGRSTGWHNTMTLPYPAHLAAAPDQAHPAYHGRADPASAAHAGRAAAPRDEAPGPAAASGASPAQSSPCASSSSGVAAASAARAPPPLRLQLSECLPDSQDTPSLFSEDSPWATAEAARGAPWWMCPPTSPARGPLQPRAGAPVGRQGPAAGRPAEAPAEAACGRGQAPAVKDPGRRRRRGITLRVRLRRCRRGGWGARHAAAQGRGPAVRGLPQPRLLRLAAARLRGRSDLSADERDPSADGHRRPRDEEQCVIDRVVALSFAKLVFCPPYVYRGSDSAGRGRMAYRHYFAFEVFAPSVSVSVMPVAGSRI
ncbi:unnamed protein product [Prorocentrum cordatum]|uniref:Uncharacterized protein n=1 Tax=Prorocentrum cordatum TaxID=2364126 RepID=A0ABN9VT53_9DINO|nr:unnamed protein product [Polarella glacialis]